MTDYGIVVSAFCRIQAVYIAVLVIGILVEFQRKYNVLCGHRCAVMEGRIFSQMEGIGHTIVRYIPGLSQTGFRIFASAHIHIEQRIINLIQDLGLNICRIIGRVQGIDIRSQSYGKTLFFFGFFDVVFTTAGK